MPNDIYESALSLEEFVRLPTTIEAHVLNTRRFQDYVRERPYIKVGPKLKSGAMPIYTSIDYISNIFKDLGSNYVQFQPRIISPLGTAENDTAGIRPVIAAGGIFASGFSYAKGRATGNKAASSGSIHKGVSSWLTNTT